MVSIASPPVVLTDYWRSVSDNTGRFSYVPYPQRDWTHGSNNCQLEVCHTFRSQTSVLAVRRTLREMAMRYSPELGRGLDPRVNSLKTQLMSRRCDVNPPNVITRQC